MKTRKDITLKLLEELTGVCDDIGIKYFISGELALFEAQKSKIKEEFNNASIAVFAGDIKKLCTALSKREDRYVESLANNSKFPGFYVRYSDTSTTLLDFLETSYIYDVNSIGINIEIICAKPKETAKKRLLSLLKSVWVNENRSFYLRKLRTDKGSGYSLAALFFKAAKHTSLMKKLFDSWIKIGSAKSKTYELATAGGYMVQYSAGAFKSSVKTTHIGTGYDIVSRPGKFADVYFDGNKKLKPVVNDICELDVPWQVFSQILKDNDVQPEKDRKFAKYYLAWKADVYIPKNFRRKRYYSYMFCAEDRMLMYKEFNGDKKQQVLCAYECGDYDKLRDLLEGYIGKIKEYAFYNVGFCSDPDIFDAALSLMIHDIYDKTRRPEIFRNRTAKIISIVEDTDYRHFDSVKNVFWGERQNEDVLKARKKQSLEKIEKEIASYYDKYQK